MFLVPGPLEWSLAFCVCVSFWEKDAEFSAHSQMSLNLSVLEATSVSYPGQSENHEETHSPQKVGTHSLRGAIRLAIGQETIRPGDV